MGQKQRSVIEDHRLTFFFFLVMTHRLTFHFSWVKSEILLVHHKKNSNRNCFSRSWGSGTNQHPLSSDKNRKQLQQASLPEKEEEEAFSVYCKRD